MPPSPSFSFSRYWPSLRASPTCRCKMSMREHATTAMTAAATTQNPMMTRLIPKVPESIGRPQKPQTTKDQLTRRGDRDAKLAAGEFDIDFNRLLISASDDIRALEDR